MDLITVDKYPVGINADQHLIELSKTVQHFDPAVVGVPANTKLVARTEEEDILYMVIQKPLILGPFIANPNVKPHQVSVALKEMLVLSRIMAQDQGIGDIYVFTSDPSVAKFAESVGMELMPESKIYRKRSYPTVKEK